MLVRTRRFIVVEQREFGSLSLFTLVCHIFDTCMQFNRGGGTMDKPSKDNDQAPTVRLRQIRKPGSLQTLKKKMWRAVLNAEDILASPHVSVDQQLRAINTLVQAGGAYGKLLEATDLQEQLDTLKAEVAHLRGQMPLRKVS